MARKSRKNVEISQTSPCDSLAFNVAAYLRLSADDRRKKGDSIETQRNIIENFIGLNPDMKMFDCYIDNGITGTKLAEVR